MTTKTAAAIADATAYITHIDCLKHDMGSYHPECPQRLSTIAEQLEATGLLAQLQYHDAPLATTEQLARVHAPGYITAIQNASPQSGLHYLDPDTTMNPHTLNAALRAAGAVVLAVDLVMTQQAANAFCAVRPPGHHAESARAMGFCIFNNIAVGVAHALEQYGLQRAAILDFDVHHGNGTEEIFGSDEHVLLCSTFQHPFYPNCGVESHPRNCINVPLAAGSDGSVFRQAVLDLWLPAVGTFRPEIIFISAGFDAHREDEMAQLILNDADYVWITQQIKTLAEKYAQGRIVSVLEGGYALKALGRCVTQHIKVLCN
ncbi:Acetoin utilization deacetylase AcuC [Nitrosomonas aestuarii]|uniref:Acetoin utilization deacetylase AcuC n=1 Tax=Nitrosomonas aestuarii TaxID=52441 RepID=A0A1I4ARQ0_9PROT|nr:histone deacetylase family protein [Nitrosomonas aestuarii]SFK59202.1 Acetoin utilization deacetylase AcuC [Nitrosomonas aestuarii]